MAQVPLPAHPHVVPRASTTGAKRTGIVTDRDNLCSIHVYPKTVLWEHKLIQGTKNSKNWLEDNCTA